METGDSGFGTKIDTPDQETAHSAELIAREQERWEPILGKVAISPPPDYLTSDVEKNLSDEGFDVFYIPPVLHPREDTVDSLRKIGPGNFSRELAQKYPNWRSHEDLRMKEGLNPTASQDSDRAVERQLQVTKDLIDLLPDPSLNEQGKKELTRALAQKRDHDHLSLGQLYDPSIPRGLDREFWEAVARGDIPFPSEAAEGKWVAVERLPKASTVIKDADGEHEVEKYEDTPFTERLNKTRGFSRVHEELLTDEEGKEVEDEEGKPIIAKEIPLRHNRFNIDPADINSGLREVSDKFFKDMDLPSLRGYDNPNEVIRPLTAMELNILASRNPDWINPGDNLTHVQELTSTPWRGYGKVVVGADGDAGKTGFVVGTPRMEPGSVKTGFRAAIILT